MTPVPDGHVHPEEIRQRVDVVALNRLPQLSRAYVKRLITEQRITVNRNETKPGYRLRAGDTLEITFDPSELEKIESIDLPIVYEDNDVIVINKPAGVISHARGKFWNEPSVASFVRERTHQSGERAGIVHRLDRATSGLMICAKNQPTLAYLQKQFADRTIKKVYRAVVSGDLQPPEAIIDMPIERNPVRPTSFRVGQAGKPAQTHYKVIGLSLHHCLVELSPLTGRTHQLRVHLSARQHPIVGDELYGGESAARLFLHAYTLGVQLPSGENRQFSAPIPPEFAEIMEMAPSS